MTIGISMFGFGKKKNQCKKELLQKILHKYESFISIKGILQGKEEIPKGYDLEDMSYSLVELSNTMNPLILEIQDCDNFSYEEIIYWTAHLNQFSATILRQLGGVEINNSISYYKVAIEAYELLESKTSYPYYDIPDLLSDLNNYAYTHSHLAQVRREYASLVSEFGDEDETEKIIIKNIKMAKKSFKVNQDAFLTYAETLWQASQFYVLNESKEAVKYAEEAVKIVEQRSDLKTHMENNDLTLLRYKLAYLLALQKNDDWDLADKLMAELNEYGEYKLEAHESAIFEHIRYKGSFTCEEKILKSIQSIHDDRNNLEQTASEYSDKKALELVNLSLTNIGKVIQEIEKCEEINPYWKPHLFGFMGYIHARKSDKNQSGKNFQKSFKLFEKLEKSQPISDFHVDEIKNITGGYFYNSVISSLGYAASIKNEKKADKEYLNVVEMAKKICPNNEHRTFTVALKKAGERFSFPFRTDEKDCQLAINLFKTGINLLEKEGTLEEFISNGDITLLFFKDWLKSNLEHCGSIAESEEIQDEIKPYEEYISWRYEENLLNMEPKDGE